MNNYIHCCNIWAQNHFSKRSLLNMADDEDLISTDNQFLIEYYWEDLVKRMNISSSSLIDILIGNDVLTHKEGEDLKVFYKLTKVKSVHRKEISQRLCIYIFVIFNSISDKRKVCKTTGCKKK